MNSYPKVSVIIPTYNRWPYICDSIDSVLKQSYQNVECVVIDDTSTDGTYEKLKQKYDQQIVVLKNKTNKEKSYSRNRGIRECSGDYVCFLDSDDILRKEAIYDRLKYFLENPTFEGVVFGIRKSSKLSDDELIKNYNNAIKEELTWLDLYCEKPNLIYTESFLVSKKNMLKYGLFNEKLLHQEESELIIRLLCNLDFYFCNTIIADTRKLDISSKRNYKNIIKQNLEFSKTIKNNNLLRTKLGEKNLHKLIIMDYYRYLIALYQERKTYRKNYIKSYLIGVKKNYIPKGERLKSFTRFLKCIIGY